MMSVFQDMDKGVRRDGAGRFVPGSPGGPGRPSGSQNKRSRIDQRLLKVLDDLGGDQYLLGWARAHPTDFIKLLVRTAPTRLRRTAPEPQEPTLDLATVVRELHDQEFEKAQRTDVKPAPGLPDPEALGESG